MTQLGLGAFFEVIYWIFEGIQALLEFIEMLEWFKRKR